jgi:hypothetical protein
MRILGYTFSNSDVYCTKHTSTTTDEDNESGKAYAIYSTEEVHSDVVCDVAGCGVILAKNVEVDSDDE